MQVKSCTLIKPISCKKGTNIVDAAKILREQKQRRLIVVDDKNYPIGIISTTDMSNKIVAEAKDAKKMKVEDIMSSPVYLICDMEDDLIEIYRKMHLHKSFFVPITKSKRLYGVLTYGELVKRVQEMMKNG